MDYFGPAATAGPYTTTEADEVAHDEGLHRVVSSPGGVPASPDGPGDIVPAVEIGGVERHELDGTGVVELGDGDLADGERSGRASSEIDVKG
jgi:hypothetical protein